jgi:capsular polysaccharide export protein
MHPFDPDLDGWRAIVTAKAARRGIADRVRFIERYDLEPLLRAAVGVVTINSTVGPLALAQSCPVFCLGRAVYDIAGITARCGLDEFWYAPPPVDGRNFDTMCRAMRATALVNGGFHDERALGLLIDGAVRRLTEASWAAADAAA